MAEYHVGCGAFGIYAGRLNRDKSTWMTGARSDVTDEAVCAVRDYLFNQIENGENTFGYEWTMKDGKTIRLVVKITENQET